MLAHQLNDDQENYKLKLQTCLDYYRSLRLAPIPVCKPMGKGCIQHKGCTHPGKVPLIKGWQNLDPNREDQAKYIDGLFEKYQWQCNVGLVTGKLTNLYVLDIDGSTDQVLAAGYELPQGVIVTTGRAGGYHHWMTPGEEALTKKIGLVKKTDFIAEGGYVLAPPSVHISGNSYTFQNDYLFELLNGGTLPPVPEWIREGKGLAQVVDLPLANDDEVGIGQRAREFLRNGADSAQRDEAVNAIVNLLGRGLDRDEVVRRVFYALSELSPQHNPSWPWTEEDVSKMVDSFERQGGPRAAKSLSPTPYLVGVEEEEEEAAVDPKTDSSQVESLLGIMKRYQETDECEPVIEGLIGKGEFIWFFAPPNTGKTFVAIDWAMHIASGRPYQGVREVAEGKVIVIEQDREQDPIRYLETHLETGKWNDALEAIDRNLLVAKNPRFSLRDKAGLLELLGFIDKNKPSVVILDSCAQFCANDTIDSSYVYVHKFKEAMVARKIAVIMLDHSIANPEFTGSDGQEKRDLDKLYGGQAKRKIIDTGIYMKGALKEGQVEIRWAKFQGGEPDPILMSYDVNQGFRVRVKFDPSKHTWTRAEKAIIEALSSHGPMKLDEMASETGLTDRTLRKALPSMVSRQQVNRYPEETRGGRGIAVTYALGDKGISRSAPTLVGLDDDEPF